MSVDQYSICPCGSGKKIKFCKCKDSIHEMERVLKMMSGGQMVAALDRLNQILEEHPGAAWCLAIKGRLLLELKEDDALAENAERFIRLQPSNPLALTQQAASRGMKGETKTAAESLLQALAESGSGVDTFVLDVASVLSLSFAQAGNLLSSRCFGGLALSATGYENNQLASMAIEEVNRSGDVSSMLKGVPTLDATAKDSSVRERYNEAAGLLRANQILLAETKFDSLVRTNSGEEAVLQGALICAVWRGDADRQSQLLRKLSDIETVDEAKRARYLALSMLVESDQPQMSTPSYNFTWEIEDIDLVEQQLLAAECVVQLPPEVIRMAGSQDENSVPPRGGFQLCDREIPNTDSLPNIEDAPIVLTTALLFGKQTDRSARLELITVCDGEKDQALKFFTGLEGVSDEPETEEMLVPLMSSATPNMPIMKVTGSQADAQRLQVQLINREFAARVLTTPLKMFGGKSAEETLDDEKFKLQRIALARIVESYDAMFEASDALAELRTKLGVAALPTIEIKKDDELYSLHVDQLAQVDVDKLTEEQLFVLMDRARAFRCTPVVHATADRILKLDLPEDRKQQKLVAYMNLVDACKDVQASLAIVAEAKQWAKSNEVTTAPLLLSELARRLGAGDAEGFQGCLKEITTDHGNDPQVMARLQQLLVNFGLINPDGSPRQSPNAPAPMGLGADAPQTAPAPAPASSGELWTPGSPSPPQPSAGGGTNKLWVPGSD